MDVLRCRAQAAMTEQDLDGPQVRAGLEQMSGEAVPQRVNRDALAQSGFPSGPLADLVDGVNRDGPLEQSAGEEVLAGPHSYPVSAEHLQQPGREHDVAILAALALANADDHPLAVDILDAQFGDL